MLQLITKFLIIFKVKFWIKRLSLLIFAASVLSSCGLTQKLLCEVSMEPDEYNTAFSRNKCDAVVNEYARHWYLN